MINNLTASANSEDWTRTPDNSKTGRRTALKRGFFMSAARLYLPVMVGWVELPSGRSAFRFWADSAKLHLTDHPIEIRTSVWWSLKPKRSTIMAQLRQKSDQLSVYAKRVQRAIQFHLPKFGESPRILLDPKEISSLSRISVDNVIRGVQELEREGYIARMFKGRRSKAHVFALLNPELKGKAGVWA